jgi:hypothetical protein
LVKFYEDGILITFLNLVNRSSRRKTHASMPTSIG